MDINPQIISSTSIFELQNSVANAKGQQKIKAVAAQFAAVFVNEMLQTARKAKLGDNLMDSDQSKLAQKLYFQQLATDLTQNDGLGITELLTRQIEYQEKSNGKT